MGMVCSSRQSWAELCRGVLSCALQTSSCCKPCSVQDFLSWTPCKSKQSGWERRALHLCEMVWGVSLTDFILIHR